MVDYLIRFVVKLDPNGGIFDFPWPKYTTQSPVMLTFLDGLIPLALTEDTYRAKAMAALTNVTLSYPI